MTLPAVGRLAQAAAALLSFPWRVMVWSARSPWRLLALVLITFSLLAGSSVGAYTYWSSPGFCHSCHIMAPYCASWAASKHAGVRCVDCHFEPGLENELHGKWVAVKQLASAVTGAYSSMPYAEVADASCLRSGCHTRTELATPVTFSDRQIRFDHASHLGALQRGIVLACTSCHNQHTLDVHMEIDRSTCFLCHFEGAGQTARAGQAAREMGDCETCHGPPTGTIEVAGQTFDHEQVAARGMRCLQCHAEMVSGSGHVDRGRCLSCHNQPEQLAKVGDVGLLHLQHVTVRKLHCYQCHGMIEHAMPEHRVHGPGTSAECGQCHADGSHSEPARLYAGVGAKLSPARPDAMHRLGVDCAGCHESAARAASPSQHRAPLQGADTCRSCHGDAYDRFVPAMAELFGGMQGHLAARIDAVRAAMENRRQASALVERDTYQASARARDDLQLVQRGVAIHNPLYAIEVLRAAERALASAEAALGIDEPEELPIGFAAEDCTACHDSLPMPGDLVLDDGRKYPHPPHALETGLGCADCHAGDAHPGTVHTSPAACKQCHPDKKE
jgi:hypothetical protein